MNDEPRWEPGRHGNLVVHRYREGHVFWFHCPGCHEAHRFETPRWTFNGNFDAPTFSPSLLYRASGPRPTCHLYMRAGALQFLSDCGHALAGQTVPIPEPPGWLL